MEMDCDMDYQKYWKIIASKEVCLHYVTLPFLKFLQEQNSEKMQHS